MPSITTGVPSPSDWSWNSITSCTPRTASPVLPCLTWTTSFGHVAGPTMPSAVEALALLERLDRRLGVRAEVAVHGDGVVAGAQELLQRAHGEDVVAAAYERPGQDRIGHVVSFRLGVSTRRRRP